MNKFNNKYRRESNRMPGWDYSRNGYYFITPVILNMKCLLGEIKNNKMILSDFGEIASDEWHNSFQIRQELFLDEFILMPNHLHAIIIINNSEKSIGNDDDGINNGDENDIGNGDRNWNVQTHGRASVAFHSSHSSQKSHSKSHRAPKSISSFMAGFKSASTSRIDDFIDEHNLPIPKFNRNNRLWQTNYHDHIIRNNEDYWRIKRYIRKNPTKWNEDKFRS